jgi:hypothetical protein
MLWTNCSPTRLHFFECFALAHIDHKDFLLAHYLAYTGSEIGSEEEEDALVELLKQRIPKGMDARFGLRYSRDVSPLQCLIRATQYQRYADALGQTYLSHEFRGTVLNLAGRLGTDPAFKTSWEKVIKAISAGIEHEYGERMEWIHSAIVESVKLWQKFDMPLFLAMALQKCTRLEDLFAHVTDIRDRALPVRHLLGQLLGAGEKSHELLKEAREFSYALSDVKPTYSATKLSWRVSVPLSVALSADLRFSQRRSTAFVRDIYDNYSIPYTLKEDVRRVFGLNKFDVSLLDMEPERPDEKSPFDQLIAEDWIRV